MPLGVIQTGAEHTPGTVLLFDEGVQNATIGFKHSTGKNAHLVLVPQPTNSPNDPLNWPTTKKDLVFAILFINTIILASVPAPLLAPSTFALSGILHVSLTKVAELSGYQLLVVGCFGPVVSALARKYGKRPQFVFAGVMATIGTATCIGSGTNYHTLLAGRLIQGFGTTAFESLAVAVIGDLYFVHERPSRTGLMILTLTCMSSLVAIIGGPITQHLGWRYMFIIHIPFVVLGALAVVFLVPETQFRRPAGDMGNLQKAMDELAVAAEMKRDAEVFHYTDVKSKVEETRKNDTSTELKNSFSEELKLFTGTYTDTNLVELVIAPLVTILNPAVFWTLLDAGVVVALYVSVSYILAQIWSEPPYLLGPAGNGYFYVGGLLGGIIGGIGGAYLTDITTKKLTRLNRGTYEPEFRIPVQIIAAFLVGLGWFIFMWDVEHPTPHGYYLGAFCHGCICAGITVASTSTSLYILDAYREQAVEIFILQMTTKNLLFYGFSTFINSWMAEKGPGTVFRTYGIVTLCIIALCIPMYIFGKLNRRYIHNSGVFKKLGAAYM